MNSIKGCEYSRSRSFHDDLILQDQASGERSQDQWSSGLFSTLSVAQLLVVEKHVTVPPKIRDAGLAMPGPFEMSHLVTM